MDGGCTPNRRFVAAALTTPSAPIPPTIRAGRTRTDRRAARPARRHVEVDVQDRCVDLGKVSRIGSRLRHRGPPAWSRGSSRSPRSGTRDRLVAPTAHVAMPSAVRVPTARTTRGARRTRDAARNAPRPRFRRGRRLQLALEAAREMDFAAREPGPRKRAEPLAHDQPGLFEHLASPASSRGPPRRSPRRACSIFEACAVDCERGVRPNRSRSTLRRQSFAQRHRPSLALHGAPAPWVHLISPAW
jgi:hypothetical protein